MPDKFGGIEVSETSSRDKFGGIPVSDAQNLGMTGRKRRMFGEVTKGGEPGVEVGGPVSGPLMAGGELVRRTMNVPSQLTTGQEQFPPGASLLPAEGVMGLLRPLHKYVVLPGELELGQDPQKQAMLDQQLYQKYGVPPPVTPHPVYDITKGLIQGGLQATEQFATPENVALAVGAAVAPEAGLTRAAVQAGLLSYFFPQIMGEQLPQAAGRASAVLEDPTRTLQEKSAAVGETAGLGTAGLGLGLEGLKMGYAHKFGPPPMLRPEEFPTPTAATMDELAGRIPPERQLPAPPTRMQEAQARMAAQQVIPGEPPAQPTFFAGPTGVSQPVGKVADLYKASQPRPPAGLLRAPTIPMGPTVFPQAIENVERQFKGLPVEEPPGLVPGQPEPMLPERFRLTREQRGLPRSRFYQPPPDIKMFSGLGGREEFEAARKKAAGLIGNFYGGELKAKDVPDVMDVLHSEAGLGHEPATGWRYRNDQNAVLWNSVPSEDMRAQVNELLESRGKGNVRHITPESHPDSIDNFYSFYSGLGGREQYDALVGKLREFLARGDLKGAEEVQKDIIELNNRQPVPGYPPQKQLKADDLRPAVKVGGRVLIGEYGDAHRDILIKNGIDPSTIPHSDERRGFVDINNPQELISRRDAERRTGLKGTADAGGLDSMDLPGAAMRKLERESELENAIPELRTDKLSKAQAPGDIQKMGEEVRQRADAEGAAREETPVPGKEGVQGRPETRFLSGIDPEELKRAVRAGRGYAAAKIGEGVPKLVYKVTSKGEAKEITDQYDLGKAIAMTDEKHYWMDKTGRLVERPQPNNTHYLAAKNILGEKNVDPEAVDLRDTYKKMRGKGYARVLEQDDAVYVKGAATDLQIQKAKALADKGKKELYVGNERYQPPESPFVEELEDEGPPPDIDDQRDYPDEPYYSGIPIVETTKDLVDHLFGRSVNRSMQETMRYYAGRAAGKTVPHTLAANANVANKLVRAAAADIALATAKAGPVIERQYKKKVASELYDAYINAKLGQKYQKGTTAPPGMRYAEVGRKPIWLRSDLIPELKRVFDRKTRIEDSSTVHYLLNLATTVQLIGPTDLMFHTANMIASMSYALGKGSDLNDVLLNLPAVGTIDAITRVAREWQRLKVNDPQVQRELVGIAKIGGLRGIDTTASMVPDWLNSSKFIQKVDRAGRLARNKMFDDLVRRKLVENTEENRREFINKMGQYNERLMGEYQSFFRKTFSPFVVAGRTFNRNAMENLIMSNPGKALNPQAYLRMKAIQFVNLTTAAVVVPVVINSMITGKPFGRPGTDPGAIDTGKDDANGRPVSIDLLQLNLVRRALRISGAQAIYRGVEADKKVPDIAGDAADAIIHGLIHPWMGPPARLAFTSLTGKTPEGYTIAKDPESTGSRLAAGLSQINPIYAALSEGKETKEGPLLHVAQRYGSVIGIKEGKYPKHEDILAKEQGQKVGEMEFGDRLLAEKEHSEKEKAERALKPPGLRVAEEIQAGQKAVKNIIKRGPELQAELDKPDRQWLESRGLIIPGYDNKFSLAKQKVYLTEDEMARYTDLIKENTSTAIEVLRESYDSLDDPDEKARFYSEVMSLARQQARGQLEAEMMLKNVPKKKKKRFSIFRSAPEEGVPVD